MYDLTIVQKPIPHLGITREVAKLVEAPCFVIVSECVSHCPFALLTKCRPSVPTTCLTVGLRTRGSDAKGYATRWRRCQSARSWWSGAVTGEAFRSENI